MENYSYTARDDYGKEVRGAMMADNEIDLANKINNLGYFLVRYKILSGGHIKVSSKLGRIKIKELLNFSMHLATLLDAGVPLATALRDLAQDEEKETVQKIIDDIRFHVESGLSLKDSLLVHPSSFPKLYTAIVGAGENTGKLSVCLNDLCSLLSWQIELRTKMKEAATYPIILFVVMLGVVTLLVVKVIPTFEPMFKDMGVALPIPTQVVLNISHFVRNGWYYIIGSVIFTVVGYKVIQANPKGRYQLDTLKLKFPLFGPLARKVALSRFCHTFALGLKSGVNLLTSLEFASEVVHNSRLQRSVIKARDSINVGEKLATSFKVSEEFPPLIVRMIGVGEQSGTLPQALDKVNQFYDREIPATIRTIFALFEPMMIVFMALVVGGIAIAIFLPMFRMVEIIGG